MRVSDAERAEVTNALCRHLGDGRLDEAEFNERVARANGAKTYADLRPLLADLPPLVGLPATPRPPVARRLGWLVLAVVLGLTVAWSLADAATGFLHPRVPWLFIGVVALLVLRGRRWRRSC